MITAKDDLCDKCNEPKQNGYWEPVDGETRFVQVRDQCKCRRQAHQHVERLALLKVLINTRDQIDDLIEMLSPPPERET